MSRWGRMPSAGARRPRFLGLLFVVVLFGGYPASGAAAAEGTLTVEIAPRSSSGERWRDYFGPDYVSLGWSRDGARTIWVYAWNTRETTPAKHLIGSRRMTVESVTPPQPVVARVPAGDYAVDVVVAGDSVWPPFAFGCYAEATVRSGAETRVALGGCRLESRAASDVQAASAQTDDQKYAHMAGRLGDTLASWRRNHCDPVAGPLTSLYQRAKSTPPREPVVFIREYWIGENYDRTLYGRDIDGAQVRRMVEALKYWCWRHPFRELWYEDSSLPADEQDFKYRIRRIIEGEMRKLEQLNALADALDAARR